MHSDAGTQMIRKGNTRFEASHVPVHISDTLTITRPRQALPSTVRYDLQQLRDRATDFTGFHKQRKRLGAFKS